MAKKKKASKRKYTEEKLSKAKQSKKLMLLGECPDYSRFKVTKNQPKPESRHSTIKRWDHLIARLDAGDEIPMEKTDAGSFANRARNLGYVVVMRRRGEDKYLIWFGGLKK